MVVDRRREQRRVCKASLGRPFRVWRDIGVDHTEFEM